MEILSCHSNQSAYATAIKNNIIVEANAMNISAKFQLHPPYSFWGVDFLIFFANWAFWLPWQPIKLRGLVKKHMFGRGPFNKHWLLVYHFTQHHGHHVQCGAKIQYAAYKFLYTSTYFDACYTINTILHLNIPVKLHVCLKSLFICARNKNWAFEIKILTAIFQNELSIFFLFFFSIIFGWCYHWLQH